MKRFPLAALGGATVLVLGLLWAGTLRRASVMPRVVRASLQGPADLNADGHDTTTLTIDTRL